MGNLNNTTLYNNREEKKYIVPLSKFDEIIKEVELHMEPYYPKKGVDYTLVESTYMDTPDLDFINQHLADNPNRNKIRLRSYGPNGKWGEDDFLEAKFKRNNVGKKQRIRIDASSLAKIQGGAPLPEDVIKLNKDVPESDFYKTKGIIDSLTKKGVNPVTGVSYKRQSFKDGDFRITIDMGLAFKSYAQAKKYDSASLKSSDKWDTLCAIGEKLNPSIDGVLEVKYPIGGSVPQWAKLMIQEYAKSDEGFSKYAWSMYQALK